MIRDMGGRALEPAWVTNGTGLEAEAHEAHWP